MSFVARVARALRGTVFLDSLTPKTKRCAPSPAHRSFAAPRFIPLSLSIQFPPGEINDIQRKSVINTSLGIIREPIIKKRLSTTERESPLGFSSVNVQFSDRLYSEQLYVTYMYKHVHFSQYVQQVWQVEVFTVNVSI